MKAHQIIQTSCRRGITGGGSGFQVYSCDKELAEAGLLNGVEYQGLFVYDTPVEVGISSFGYAYVEGRGSVFSLNTRLAHDFAGEGTRSGNLLNHSLLVEGALDCHPAELFGSALLRSEMAESEVNSDDQPDYLPMVDAIPSGSVSLTGVGEWLDERDGIEVLERLMAAYVAARAEGKILVIFDTPANVVRWVAALEYCLPRKVASHINFVNFSENAASVNAHISGTTRELFEKNTPAFMHASVVVFDPIDCSDHPMPSGPFIDFIDIGYSLNPSSIGEFSAFLEENIEMGEAWDLASLDAAYAVYSLTKDDFAEWTRGVIEDGLRYALERGGPSLNVEIVQVIRSNYERLSSLDTDTYLIVLEYLIRLWPRFNDAGKSFIERVAVDNVLEILRKPGVDEAEFQDYFNAITRACASAGLNIFELLMEDGSRDQVFSSAGQLGVGKLRQLAISLTEFVVASGQPVEKLAVGNPLGDLYANIVASAITQGMPSGIGVAQAALAASVQNLAYLENLTVTLEWPIRSAFAQRGATGSIEESAAVEALWDSCMAALADHHFDHVREAIDWLLWASRNDASRYRYLADLYDRLAMRCRSLQDAVDLFELFCGGATAGDEGFQIRAYPAIASRYAMMLRSYDDREALEIQRELLIASLDSSSKLDFVSGLAESVSQSFNLKRLSKEDRSIVTRACQYERRTGGYALVGKLALACVADVLQRADKLNDYHSAIDEVENLSETLSVSILDSKELRDYFKLIAPEVAGIVQVGADVGRLVDAFGLSGEALHEFLSEAYASSAKTFTKRGDATGLAALNAYVASIHDAGADDACLRTLATFKAEEDLAYVDSATRQVIRFSGDVAAERRWARLIERSGDRAGRGLFGRLRR